MKSNAYSFSYYLAIFIILFILIFALLVVSPAQDCFFDFKEKYPYLYEDIHGDKQIYRQLINEIVSVTGISRIDEPNIPIKSRFSERTSLIWLNANESDIREYVRGNIQILPLFYDGKYYSNISYFPQLMNILYKYNNILNVFFWKMPINSAFLQHVSTSIISGHKVLRYTLAINPLTVMEEECSLWVNGKIKRLAFDDYVLWNINKEFSLHNNTNTDDDILFLNIDLEECK